eukprot:2218813-Alexandrium_andersonii.AAC.1
MRFAGRLLVHANRDPAPAATAHDLWRGIVGLQAPALLRACARLLGLDMPVRTAQSELADATTDALLAWPLAGFMAPSDSAQTLSHVQRLVA